MRIMVEYTAQAKKEAGIGTEQLSLSDGLRLEGALAMVVNKHGEKLARLIHGADGSRNPSILISVNNEQVSATDDPALSDGDIITIMTPMSGG